MIVCRSRLKMSFSSTKKTILALAVVFLLTGADTPDLLRFDGEVIISAEYTQGLLDKGFTTEKLNALALDRARDLVARALITRAEITPSEELARTMLDWSMENIPLADKTLLELELKRSGKSRAEYIDTIAVDPETQFKMACLFWIERDIAPKISVSDSEISEFYRANPSFFELPARRSLEVIALPLDASGAAAVRLIMSQLAQGEDFAKLKEKYCVAIESGLEKLNMRQEVLSAGLGLTPESPYCDLLLKDCRLVIYLEGYQAGTTISLEESRELLRKNLRELKVRDEVNRVIAEESLRHEIIIRTESENDL